MTRAIVGVDNYSFHRRLGEVRPGEQGTGEPIWPWNRTISAAADAGADAVALETCFMTAAQCRAVLPEVSGIACMLSWGHPYGLEYGQSAAALEDALEWLALAAELGHRRMRITIAHPHLREGDGWSQARGSVAAVARLAEAAAARDVRLGIENHADVTADQLAWILAEVDSPALGVCLDTANAVRVGDDPLRAAEALASHVIAAHVKDLASDPWHPRSGPRSVPLGTGVLPIPAVLDVLHQSVQHIWYLVELAQLGDGPVDEQAWIARDIAWLREQLGG
jgi:sugar phosphate isomerase/epimerase